MTINNLLSLFEPQPLEDLGNSEHFAFDVNIWKSIEELQVQHPDYARLTIPDSFAYMHNDSAISNGLVQPVLSIGGADAGIF